jgi:hypothetical protein
MGAPLETAWQRAWSRSPSRAGYIWTRTCCSASSPVAAPTRRLYGQRLGPSAWATRSPCAPAPDARLSQQSRDGDLRRRHIARTTSVGSARRSGAGTGQAPQIGASAADAVKLHRCWLTASATTRSPRGPGMRLRVLGRERFSGAGERGGDHPARARGLCGDAGRFGAVTVGPSRRPHSSHKPPDTGST